MMDVVTPDKLQSYREAQARFLNSGSKAYELLTFLASLPQIIDKTDILRGCHETVAGAILDYVSLRLGKITPEEFDDAQRTISAFLRVALSLDTEPLVPWHSIADGLSVNRALQMMVASVPPYTILELGGSPGCISAISSLSGFSAISVPFAESDYFLQSLLFSSLHSQSLGFNPGSLTPLVVPWWEWLSSQELTPDIIVCSSWIRNLPTGARNLVLSQLRASISLSRPGILLFYLRSGEEFLSWRSFWEELNAFGFGLVHFAPAFCLFAWRPGDPDVLELTKRLAEDPYPDPLDTIVPPEHIEWLRLALEGT